MTLTIGSLCSGYGGLELGVQAVYGGTTAWVSDIDKGACKILAHRFPGVPNIGDMTAVKWTPDCPDCSARMEVSTWDGDSPFYWCPSCQRCCDLSYREECPEDIPEPVDLICGGTPCQDLSHAGKRAGMTEGTRSNLWVAMREAIAVIRPRFVVWENVRGAYSACADSDLGRCPRCVDPSHPGGHAPLLRALGRVLGDLSDLGYDASWHGIRAADVGAPHGRFRAFIVATNTTGNAQRVAHGDGSPAALAADLGHERTGGAWDGRPGPANGGLLPTPRATDGTKGGPNQRGSSGDLMLPSAVALLPTPVAQEPGGTLEQYHARFKDGRESTFAPLSMAVQLLPTPSVADVQGGRKARSGERNDEPLLNGIAHANLWGNYAAAIARWEHVLGRPAPSPTMTSTKGNPQLSPVFVEWLMGLPAGWVTDVPGITRNEALKALGNGVVPQQAAAALREMASWGTP